ncbi:hypothetical protein V2E29_05620 [Streptomyces diastatochromogenes]|uniref:hypothetical protein n=1 Tax=Streptomyces diastatochromogenes TaxID=42236 RepID=UPI002F269308
MRKFHKAVIVAAAALGSVGAFSAGTAQAHGEPGHDIGLGQGTECRSHDMNVDVLGAVGLLNGTLGNALNGEGSPGAQPTHMGANLRCDNNAF